MEYEVSEYPPKVPGRWGGYRLTPVDKNLPHGKLFPNGGGPIEIKPDANKSLTP